MDEDLFNRLSEDSEMPKTPPMIFLSQARVLERRKQGGSYEHALLYTPCDSASHASSACFCD